MAHKMRWRYGETNPVIAVADASLQIDIGDLVYLDTDDAKPASSQADQNTLVANQDLFASKFLGVAMSGHESTDATAGTVRVATTGVFELDCASATHEVGDKIGACEIGAGTALEDQKVVKVTNAGLAIGRVAQREASAKTTVLVDIVSTVMKGGVEGSSASGM